MKKNFCFITIVSVLFSLFFFSTLAGKSLADTDRCERIEIEDSLFTFGDSSAQTPVYTGESRDFVYTAKKEMVVTSIEFSSVLASHGGLFQIELFHNDTDEAIASWNHYVSSAIFETYTHSVNMNLKLSPLDKLTYKISGITGPSPIMGSITGESLGKMYTSPCYQEQDEFYGLSVWAEIGKDIKTLWREGGRSETDGGDRVVWGYFYACPDDVDWGSVNNPDIFVKIWFDRTGRTDVNFFHVSVPDISVYSEYDTFNKTLREDGTATTSTRYIRHCYEEGYSYSDEREEDGNPPVGYLAGGNPVGRPVPSDNTLRIGAVINTVEKGPIEAIFREGGKGETFGGHDVIWGYFYAAGVNWASMNNPELFVKLWYDVSGRIDVNFFHVSVPEIEVYSDFPDDNTYDQNGTTILNNRYIRHEY
ncbi:hypothetical protein QUF72_12305 [Desulfobacterales bacterium HSG2]|nr:hypothetical protein [Desulfobacterales bacterium HSG2]